MRVTNDWMLGGVYILLAMAIVAALDLPIIHKAVVWWRGHHPVVFEPGKERSLAPEMATTLGISVSAFFLFWALLLTLRYRQRKLEGRLESVAERLGERV